MKWVLAFLLVSASLCIPAGLKRCTCSFHLSRCIPPKLENLTGALFSSLSSEEIKEILSQPFTYLDRGAQSFVFASQDGKYALKLFFFEHNSEKASALRMSCKAAMLAAEETALVYLHFGPSSKPIGKIKLCGPAWHRVTIKGSDYCFALQRMATPLKEAILRAYLNKDRDAFLKKVDALFTLLHRRVNKGIHNSDGSLFSNFGFLEDGQAIEIDFGHYRFDSKWSEEEKIREIARYKKRLGEWVFIAMPEWAEIL